jgi:glycosyltransferase involved in cell wall biosynthesis
VEVYPAKAFRRRLFRLYEAQWVHIWRVDVRSWGKDWPLFQTLVQRFGVRWSYDLDDYLFAAELANTASMDWLRCLRVEEVAMQAYAGEQQRVVGAADVFTAPTAYLAEAARAINPAVWVLPNGYDHATQRLAFRLRGEPSSSDGLLRVGYAGGSFSHQQDFQQVVPALVRILARYPQVRLVIFGKVLSLAEFPDLLPFAPQIEDRHWVAQADLPQELRRFDINLAPLELQPFCHAKSELKYFEAALLGVPTVASPTAPFQAAIRSGENGLLATSTEEWEMALAHLVEAPEVRRAMGEAARQHAEAHFGPLARQVALQALIHELGLSAPQVPPLKPSISP